MRLLFFLLVLIFSAQIGRANGAVFTLEIIANAHVLYSGQAQILLTGLDDQLFYPDFGDENCGSESTSGKPVTSVDDQLATGSYSKVNIFPNPSHSGQFTVELPSEWNNADPVSYRIYDLNGHLQSNGYLPTERNNLSIEQSPPGVYIIAIQQGNYTIRRKIIYQ